MASGRFIAYYRVSTQQQGRSGLGPDAQRQAVSAYLNGGAWHLVAGFTEVESGKGSNALDRRPQLRQALEACRKHKATLLIAKLDRLARNVHFVTGLIESGVDFVAADAPHAVIPAPAPIPRTLPMIGTAKPTPKSICRPKPIISPVGSISSVGSFSAYA